MTFLEFKEQNFKAPCYVLDNDFVSKDFLKAKLCEDRVDFSLRWSMA